VKIGITVGLGARAESRIDGLRERVNEFEQRGFATVWMANANGFDAMTALAVAGRDTSRVELGTAVVPTYPRHPVVMAQQALTTQDALGGRFTLGIGLSHEGTISGSLGLPFEQPAKHMKEYLAVLTPLLDAKPASVSGEMYRVEASLVVAGAERVPIIVAAMGPLMLKLAGRAAEGTVTSWVGLRTLADHIVPTITSAAEQAGRPAPRIVAGLPIALTNDADAGREYLAQRVGFYDTLPSYRAMFDREGVARGADVALIGDEAELDKELTRLQGTGATDFAAQVVRVESGSTSRTIDYLQSRIARAP
jgi:5,10-methylenetetrahydromethanopterin reductase